MLPVLSGPTPTYLRSFAVGFWKRETGFQIKPGYVCTVLYMRKTHVAGVLVLLFSVCVAVFVSRPGVDADKTPPDLATTQPSPTTLDLSTCDAACVIKEAQAIAQQDSPSAALAWINSIADVETKFGCHASHHAVGVDVGRRSYPNFPDVITTDCQYGYLHGTLQGVATELSYDKSGTYGKNAFEKMLYWLQEGSMYCKSLNETAPKSPSKVRNATDECMHALGHGAAVIEFDDLASVLKACSAIDDVAFACADGAMMEYADDIWDRAGWVHWETGYTEITTSFDLKEAAELCQNVADSIAQACWRRIGSFVGPMVDGDPALTGEACLTAPTKAYKDECLYSAATIGVENAHRESPAATWPPENDQDAQDWVRSAVVECQRWPDFDICLKGFIAPPTSHLYTANLGDLVARSCDAEKGRVREICLAALAQAEHDK